MNKLTALIVLGFLSGCDGGGDASDSSALSPEQQATYQDCLDNSQAVAEAWENIEQRCREQVSGTAPQLPE